MMSFMIDPAVLNTHTAQTARQTMPSYKARARRGAAGPPHVRTRVRESQHAGRRSREGILLSARVPDTTGEDLFARSGLLLHVIGFCLDHHPEEEVSPGTELCVGQRRHRRKEPERLVEMALLQCNHPRAQERALRPLQHLGGI